MNNRQIRISVLDNISWFEKRLRQFINMHGYCFDLETKLKAQHIMLDLNSIKQIIKADLMELDDAEMY